MDIRSYSVYEIDISPYDKLDRYELLQLLVDISKAINQHTYVKIKACNNRNINDIAYVISLLKDLKKSIQIRARTSTTRYVRFDGIILPVSCLEIEIFKINKGCKR